MTTIIGKIYPAADLCKTCGSPFFWLDQAGRVRCENCAPAPHPRLIRERLTVVQFEGQNCWENRDLNSPAMPDQSPTAEPASRTPHHVGRDRPLANSKVRFCPYCRGFVRTLVGDGTTAAEQTYQCANADCGRIFRLF
jgi:DNA-directed RNA polymerase subunit RPC12/RpoP